MVRGIERWYVTSTSAFHSLPKQHRAPSVLPSAHDTAYRAPKAARDMADGSTSKLRIINKACE